MEEYTAGHDDYLDANIEMCSSCKDEGQTIAAVRYCVDCEEYQCNRCFKSHQRYNNKVHEVYDETSRHKWGRTKSAKLPTARCPTHVGEVLQIYCEDDDTLCCHICVAMTHSQCKRKQYIPEVAKDIAIGNQEFITLKNDIDKVQTHLQEVIDESKKNKESIQKSRESFKNLLQKNRLELEAMYTRVEQQTATDLSQAHDSIDAEVDEKIKLGNELISELEGLRVRIDPDSNTNDSQLFIGMKQMKGKVKLIQEKVELVSKPQPTGIECTTASAVNTFLNFEDNLLRQQQKNSKGAETDHLPWAQRTSKLSSIRAAQVLDGNPNVSDIIDPNRPQKLSEQLSCLYDDQWTDAAEELDKLEKFADNEELIVTTLFELLKSVYNHCKEASNNQLSRIEEHIFLPPLENPPPSSPDTNGTDTSQVKSPTSKQSGSKMKGEKVPEVPVEVRRGIKEYRKMVAKQVIPVIEKEVLQKLCSSQEFSDDVVDACKPFITKSVEICWRMCVQDPPICLKWDIPVDYKYDADRYRSYTQSGSHVQFVVWPVIYLHEGGPILMKGVAQGKDGES